MPDRVIRVLLLDTDAADRAAERHALALAGFDVRELVTPEVDAELRSDADCAVIAQDLLELDAMRIVRALQQEGRLMPVIVLLPAGVGAATVDAVMNAGAFECYTKSPVTNQMLPTAVRTAVRLGQSGAKHQQVERERRELFERERAARAAAESSRRRLAFLAEASTVLGASLDYETTLASVARLCVPDLADWCTVDILTADGAIKRLAVAHVDPSKVEYAREMDRRYPVNLADQSGVARAMRTGKSEMVAEIVDEMLVASARDADHLRIMRELGLKSGMVVPLVARGQTLGAITFIIAESKYHYNALDLALAEDLARRAAAAVDNARLYREAREAVDERNREARAVRLSEQHFKAVFNQAAMGIAESDARGRFQRMNDRFCQIVGYRAEELVGRTIEELTHPDDWPQNREFFERIIAGGDSYGIDKRYIRKDGSPVWVHIRASFIPGGPDGEAFCLAMVEDITERKRVQDDLRQAKQEAEAANASKDQFLAVLSHELRTPLTPVLTMVQVMEGDEELSSEQRSSLEMIRRNVELEARLIDDLLDLTRIAKGKLQLSLDTVDAHTTLLNAIEICRADMAEKGVRLATEFSARRHHVRADPARLQQVFWNLIKNAVKFTPTGGQVTIRATDDANGRLRVDVTDTGIGIEPENLNRIFFAFEQGEQSITRQFGGLGLGLAISKSLVDMHGGHLTASSAGKDQGSTFTARLPVTSAPINTASFKPTPSAAADSSSAAAAAEGRSLRILMVDDHEDTSRAMKRLLERLGYEVHTKHTVREAFDAVNASSYDLLISDIGLPDGSGVDLIRQLRQNANPIRALALSGFGMDEDIRKSKEAGFQDHLTKPVNFSRLQEVIAELMERSK